MFFFENCSLNSNFKNLHLFLVGLKIFNFFLLSKKYYLLVTYLPGYDCEYGCIKICFSKKINCFSLQLAGNEIKLVEAAILQ